jgi:putative ATPase
MSDLFSQAKNNHEPLAYRLRPKTIDDFVGQNHLTTHEKIISQILDSNYFPSLILWGPSGVGKTTLALILAKTKNYQFYHLSAVDASVKEIKEIILKAKEDLKLYDKPTILFLDEIHRFNKARQDVLLHAIEEGSIILIGATTENPSFEINQAILSRTKLLILEALNENDLKTLIQRALNYYQKKNKKITIEEDAIISLINYSQGDARKLLNAFELVINSFKENNFQITQKKLVLIIDKKSLHLDKKGEEYYNLISAFIKSMRGSDPDAALYYLARMLEGGMDPMFIIRRMVIFASEDIGNADPQALQIALNCKEAFHFVGLQEGWINLAQGVTYLALAPKSNRSYLAYKEAKREVYEYGDLEIPLHIRNAPTKLMKDLDYGKNYQYAHNQENQIPTHHHLPDRIKDKVFYQPKKIGFEEKHFEKLEETKKIKKSS